MLRKIVAFCRHHVEEPMDEIEKPVSKEQIGQVVQAWYAEYIDVEVEMLVEIMLAAHYMGIQPLLNLACATAAFLIKGKTADEIRKLFGITNDFTPEEEARIREENKWCEEQEE